jgi:hypothetical protein
MDVLSYAWSRAVRDDLMPGRLLPERQVPVFVMRFQDVVFD